MGERSAKERSTWNKHLRMRNSLNEQYTPRSERDSSYELPHCKVWQAPHTLDEEVISLLMELRTPLKSLAITHVHPAVKQTCVLPSLHCS